MEKTLRQEAGAAQTLMDDTNEELARLAGAVAAHLRRTMRMGRVLIPGSLPPTPKPTFLPAQGRNTEQTLRDVSSGAQTSHDRVTSPQLPRSARSGSRPVSDRNQPLPRGTNTKPARMRETGVTRAGTEVSRDSAEVTAELAANDIPGAVGLARVKALLGNCRRCPLASRRHHLVFGQGDPSAEVMFIGEAPGAEEDRQGVPFVGAAGTLLTKMLKAMGLQRKNVYVANILKCRPPNNRDPLPEEIAVCLPFLEAQVRAIQPRIIVTLGRVAAQTLLDTNASLSSLRGTFHDYKGIALMPTYHPAYLLRRPEGKRAAWHDLQLVMREMDRLGLERDRSLR